MSLEPVTTLIGAILNYNAAGEAADKLGEAANRAEATTRQYGQLAAEQYAPYSAIGTEYLARLDDMIRSGYFNTNVQEPDYSTFQAPGADFQQEPGYQFRQAEGQRAIESSAAARGSLLSGATQKALARYGQNLASQEYGNVYNRAFGQYTNMRNFLFNKYNANRAFEERQKANAYNQNAAMIGLGQWGAGNRANVYQNQGSTLANIDVMRGNIAAGKTAGQSAAVNQLLAGFDPAGEILGGVLGNGGSTSSSSPSVAYPAQQTQPNYNGVWQTDYNTNPPPSDESGESGGGMDLASLASLIASFA
jgi:hypothetical protein